MKVDLLNLLGKVLSAKRLKKYEPNYSECTCSEFTISKKKESCLVYTGLHLREILKHSLRKWMK